LKGWGRVADAYCALSKYEKAREVLDKALRLADQLQRKDQVVKELRERKEQIANK